jgi:cell division protein FtsB
VPAPGLPNPADTPRSRRTPAPLRRRQPVATPSSPLRRRAIQYLLIFVTVVLVVDAFVGEKGFMETMRARRQAREQGTQLARLRQENAQLREEMRRLREDPKAIESVAREELGLIRPGEILFILKDSKPAHRDKPAPRESAPASER